MIIRADYIHGFSVGPFALAITLLVRQHQLNTNKSFFVWSGHRKEYEPYLRRMPQLPASNTIIEKVTI